MRALALIFLAAGICAIKYDDTFCSAGDEICDISQTITQCSETIYYYAGNATVLNITGQVDLEQSRSYDDPCVTILVNTSLVLVNLSLSAPNIEIYGNMNKTVYEAHDSLFTPSGLMSEHYFFINQYTNITATGKSKNVANSGGQNLGGSYAANGGSDTSITKDTQKFAGYGRYWMNPYDEVSERGEFFGNRGQNENRANGGGRIWLATPYVLGINGSIKSEGIPEEGSSDDDSINGGSGGYIGMDVGSLFFLTLSSKISVKGGSGVNSAGYGGSGGRVFINGVYDSDSALAYSSYVEMSGGKSAACTGSATSPVNECGGAGTLYNAFDQTLHVGPSAVQSSKRTRIEQQDITPVVYVGENAIVCSAYDEGTFYPLEATDFEINGAITAAYGYQDQIVVNASTVNILDYGSIDGTGVSQILINATSQIQINSAGTVAQIGGTAVFNCKGKILYSKGMMQSYTGSVRSSLVFIGDSININSNQAAITVQKIGLVSYTSLYSEGEIKSSDGGSICNSSPAPPSADPFTDKLPEDNIFQCSKYQNKNAYQNIDDITKQAFLEFYNTPISNVTDLLPWQKTLNMTQTLLAQNYSVFMLAQEHLEIQQDILGGIIGLCGDNITIAGNSRIDASGLGCPADKGAGTGTVSSNCAGPGASFGTYGGYGAQISSQVSDCATRPFIQFSTTPTIPRYFYVGSGGTSSSTQTQGGAGGGMVLLNAKRKTTINGKIYAQGLDGSFPTTTPARGAGGGSGGIIYVQTSLLEGDGTIKVDGGKGSSPGGGGGAGGAFYLVLKHFQERSSYPNCTKNWTKGDPIIIGGEGGYPREGVDWGGDGDQGFIVSTPCQSGYGLHTCQACSIGYYRVSYSNLQCQPCTNLPAHAYYNTTAWINETCPFACDPDYTLSASLQCLSSIQEFFDEIGDIIILTVGILVFLLIIIGIILCCKLKKKKESRKSKAQTFLLSESMEGKSIMQKRNFMRKEFGIEDLPYHECRVYFFGSNGFTRPNVWALPLDPHPYVRNEINELQYRQFVQDINKAGHWTCGDRFKFILLSIVMPLLAILYRQRKRNLKYEAVKKVVQKGKENFWKKLRMRELSGSIKFSASPDHTLAYLDFMNWDKSRLDWAGVPNTPLTLLFSGNGGFFSPYALQAHDPLVESLGDILSRSGGNPRRINRVLILLNTCLSVLSFYDFRQLYESALQNLVIITDKINTSYFWPNNYSVSLVAYYVDRHNLRFEPIHSQSYLTIASFMAASIKSGRDAKLGIRIESHRLATTTTDSAFGTIESRKYDDLLRPSHQNINDLSSYNERILEQDFEQVDNSDASDDNMYEDNKTKCNQCMCGCWLWLAQFVRVLYFKQHYPVCNRCFVRFLYIFILLGDAMLSMVPVLYAFQKALRVPYIAIFFVYPLIPVISIALNIICLIVWHPMFLRVLLAFNALCALNPLTTILISLVVNQVPDQIGDFWIFSTVGMFLIKIPVAHIVSLNLAWMNFASYQKYKNKLAGLTTSRATSRIDFQSKQFAQQIRESGNWPFKPKLLQKE